MRDLKVQSEACESRHKISQKPNFQQSANRWKFDCYMVSSCLYFNSDISLSATQFSKPCLPEGCQEHRTPHAAWMLLPQEQDTILQAGKTLPDPRHSSHANALFKTTTV